MKNSAILTEPSAGPRPSPLVLRDRALAAVAAAGVLAEDLADLDLDAVGPRGLHVLVRRRSGRDRLVVLGRDAAATLSAYLRAGRPVLAGARHDPAVFLSKTGKRLGPTDVRRRIRLDARRPERRGGGIASAAIREWYSRSHPRA